MTYQLIKSLLSGEVNGAIKANDDGTITSFVFDPDNTDYQAYLKWLEAGNTPEAADATHPYQQTQEHNQ